MYGEYLSGMRTALAQLAAVNATAHEEQVSEEDTNRVCPLLSYLHIQQIIDQVNTAAGETHSSYFLK